MKKFFIGFCVIMGILGVCEWGFNEQNMLNEQNPYETQCVKAGCDKQREEGSIYCYRHNKHITTETTTEQTTKEITTRETTTRYSYSSSSSSYSSNNKKSSSSTGKTYSYSNPYSNPYKSYDEGYEAVYDDGDYDWDRYNSDSEYAEGVDDALDELDE